MIAVGDMVQVVRTSGKIERCWIVKKILPGYAPLGIDASVVVAATWQNEQAEKTVPYRELLEWQFWAVCDTHENLYSAERPSTE